MKINNILLDKVDSTQLYAQKNYKDFDPQNITCITARHQTQGFGRYMRPWFSSKNLSLTSTFYFQLKVNSKDLISLTEILCLSLAKVLIKQKLQPKIRWPNDIMLNEKKLSGVLCQTIFEKEIVHVFLGIGVNINIDEKTLKKIDKPATSLFVETSRKWEINIFLKMLQDQFLEDLILFLKDGFAPFLQMFSDLLLYKNEKITIFNGKDYFAGTLLSITSSGELKVKLKTGEIKTFSSGDLSLD